jgi:hypothetical protein
MILKFKWELPRFIAIRLVRRDIAKEEREPLKATTVLDGPDHPTVSPAPISRSTSTIDSASANAKSGPAVSTNIRPVQSCSDSSGRQVLNGANLALSVVSPLAGVVPIVGSPIEAAIDGLLVILNAVNVSDSLIPILWTRNGPKYFSKLVRTQKTSESCDRSSMIWMIIYLPFQLLDLISTYLEIF